MISPVRTNTLKRTLGTEITYYLSGPMTGYKEYNFPYFENVTKIFRGTGIKLESPHENPLPKDWEKLTKAELWLDMMVKAVDQMSRCQGIILLKGWPQSSGARRELKIAMDGQWPVYYYNESSGLTIMNRDDIA